MTLQVSCPKCDHVMIEDFYKLPTDISIVECSKCHTKYDLEYENFFDDEGIEYEFVHKKEV